MKTTIILTTTVNVNFKKYAIFQTDSNERKNLYIDRVRKWLQNTNFNIILVENSGYNYEELNTEKNIYKDRFEVITFNEPEVPEAKYLENNDSKGSSELFSINYAFNHSTLAKQSNFIIKITGRFFIPDFEQFLNQYDLDNYDALTQFNTFRCEVVGSHIKNFWFIFSLHAIDNNSNYNSHIEFTWKQRISIYPNILVCKEFNIESTQRGGCDQRFIDI